VPSSADSIGESSVRWVAVVEFLLAVLLVLYVAGRLRLVAGRPVQPRAIRRGPSSLYSTDHPHVGRRGSSRCERMHRERTQVVRDPKMLTFSATGSA
jgi:hypothetical protein